MQRMIKNIDIFVDIVKCKPGNAQLAPWPTPIYVHLIFSSNTFKHDSASVKLLFEKSSHYGCIRMYCCCKYKWTQWFHSAVLYISRFIYIYMYVYLIHYSMIIDFLWKFCESVHIQKEAFDGNQNEVLHSQCDINGWNPFKPNKHVRNYG